MAMTKALDAEEHATTAAVGEEGPLMYPITEDAPTTVPMLVLIGSSVARWVGGELVGQGR